MYLNSGSVLKYPSIFTGNIREVSLNGEAYFEVAKDPEHKFIVSTPQKSKVEVLGTHFNLEAFDEMDEVITTLVEGKVEFVYEKDGQGSIIIRTDRFCHTTPMANRSLPGWTKRLFLIKLHLRQHCIY